MANRYLRATGNWNGAVWASTSGGSAGSAATPTSSDNVYISANFTLTVNQNVSVFGFEQTNGTFLLNGFEMTVSSGGFYSSGTTARTVNLTGGKLTINDGELGFFGSNLTFVSTGSLVTINIPATSAPYFYPLSKTFNDVIFNFGTSGASGSASELYFFGSANFRLLAFISKSTAIHYVNFSDNTLNVEKFIGIGSSASSRMEIEDFSGYTVMSINDTGSSYGQYLNISIDGNPTSGAADVMYVGSNSIAAGGTPWITQDPPKISTLVDPLTIAPASNTNWTVGGSVTAFTGGYGGGGYILDEPFAPGGAGSILSTDTFDLNDSSITLELHSPGIPLTKMDSLIDSLFGFRTDSSGNPEYYNSRLYRQAQVEASLSRPFEFVKLSLSGTTLSIQSSVNGSTFTEVYTTTIPSDELPLYSSMRLSFENDSGFSSQSIYSINPNLNAPPTTALNSPANAVSLTTTTPELRFTGTDPEGDSVQYQVQVSTSSGFSPLHTDHTTTTYSSGTQQGYTISALTAGGLTYYWRVRAKDPSGSNSFGAWSTTRTMITEALPPTVTSGASSSIERSTATLAGNVTNTNGASITERGFVYATTTNPTTANTKRTVSGTTGAYTGSLTALSPNTTYYWRAYAINSKGTSYGSNQSFLTLPNQANITTVHDITFSEAQVDVEVPATGDGSITARGIVYSLSTAPTLADTTLASGSGSGLFTATMTGLSGSTRYYVRAYTTNSTGTSYSSEVNFLTSQAPSAPTVITGSAANTTDTTSEFNGNEVTLDGMATVTERGIVFSDTATTPTVDDRKIVAPASGLGTYNLGVTGLDPETTYYVRAYAVNSIGTGYGAVETFITEAPFVPDEGDGNWAWTPSGSDAVIGRSQSTNANSSVNLMLADLNLTDGETYTLYYSGKDNTNGETKMVLQWFDGGIKTQQLITPGTAYTFVYDETSILWAIRLFVTGASVEADNITATFSDMYLAQEATFSGFVPFEANGITEVKIENNWLADKQRTDVIGTMFSAMSGLSWFPFDIQTEGLGWFEIGDMFTIQDDEANEYSVVLWNSRLEVDGGINETLFTETPDLTETNYSRAGKLNGLWKRTEISVNKNTQEINSLVEAVYNFDGVINTKFSEIEQDVDEVRTTIQGSGGVNLILNSVMYAFDQDNLPESWTVTGTGSLLIQASPESLTAGAVAGNAFSLQEKTVKQTITVRKDVDFIPEEQKTYYSLSAKVKKNTVGVAWIKLINRNETLTIELPDQTSYYWSTVEIQSILPKDDYFEVEIYSDDDADLQVTDLMFAPGKSRREWSQANGEVMNSSVSITKDGMTIRSPQFQNDFTKIDALGFEVHSKEVGGDRVFGFNKDETNVSKLKADKQMSMSPLRVVPINYGTYKGWAWTLSEEA